MLTLSQCLNGLYGCEVEKVIEKTSGQGVLYKLVPNGLSQQAKWTAPKKSLLALAVYPRMALEQCPADSTGSRRINMLSMIDCLQKHPISLISRPICHNLADRNAVSYCEPRLLRLWERCVTLFHVRRHALS